MSTLIIDDNGRPLSLREICERCDISDALLRELVELGVAEPSGEKVAEWQFSATQYLRIRRAVNLQKDLGINEPGIALVMDLLDEIARIREELEHLQRHSEIF